MNFIVYLVISTTVLLAGYMVSAANSQLDNYAYKETAYRTSTNCALLPLRGVIVHACIFPLL